MNKKPVELHCITCKEDMDNFVNAAEHLVLGHWVETVPTEKYLA